MALSAIKKQQRVKELPQSDASDNVVSDSSDNESAEGNAGWADSIAKVLNTTKPKTKKTLVLSRAKKTKPGDKKQSEENYGFEVEGDIKDEKADKAELQEQMKQRKNVPLALRVKPSWKDIERERTLRKVATRGVVQLFNAVRIQQKDLQYQLDEAGPLDSRRDAVLNNINKRKFLDVLMSGNRAKSEAVDNSVKTEMKNEENNTDEEDSSPSKKRNSEWNVLRDDFMTNKKIKHWDEEDEENSDKGVRTESDSGEEDNE